MEIEKNAKLIVAAVKELSSSLEGRINLLIDFCQTKNINALIGKKNLNNVQRTIRRTLEDNFKNLNQEDLSKIVEALLPEVKKTVEELVSQTWTNGITAGSALVSELKDENEKLKQKIKNMGLQESLTEHFVILSKKLISQSGMTLQVNCEDNYRQILSQGIENVLANNQQWLNDEYSFFRGKEYFEMEANVIRFVSGWISDAKANNEVTLHESTLYRFKAWADKTFCPGFIPFC